MSTREFSPSAIHQLHTLVPTFDSLGLTILNPRRHLGLNKELFNELEASPLRIVESHMEANSVLNPRGHICMVR